MLKNYYFWIKAVILLQTLTFLAHSMSFFFTPVGENDTERQLIELMQSYHSDMGAGFVPTTQDILTAFSACFVLLYLLGALINWQLLRVKADLITWKGIIHINLFVYGISFGVMAFFTFLPPIILTGLVFLCLLIARFTFPKS